MEQKFVDEYDVSTHQLRALFTYWCNVCRLRIRRDNLVVDGRQMASLKSEPTPVREQADGSKRRTHRQICVLQSKLNHTTNHSWSHHGQYIQNRCCVLRHSLNMARILSWSFRLETKSTETQMSTLKEYFSRSKVIYLTHLRTNMFSFLLKMYLYIFVIMVMACSPALKRCMEYNYYIFCPKNFWTFAPIITFGHLCSCHNGSCLLRLLPPVSIDVPAVGAIEIY